MPRSAGGGGGKAPVLPVVAVVVVVGDAEAKLFNEAKFGVGKPKGGNAPKGGIDGKPNGRPQGRSKDESIDEAKHSDERQTGECGGEVVLLLLLFADFVFIFVAHDR